VFAFAHGVGPSGKEPSLETIGARIACMTSFYRLLIRMDIVASNPCDQLERATVSPSPPLRRVAGFGTSGDGQPRSEFRQEERLAPALARLDLR